MSKTLASLSAVEYFNQTDSLGYLGSIDDLHKKVEGKFCAYSRMIRQDVTLFEMLGRPLEHVIPDLYPLIIQDEQRVYFVHPNIIAGLTRIGLDDEILDRKSKVIVNFIELLEKMRRTKQLLTRLRYTDETEFFRNRGIDFHDLLSLLISTYRGIRLSRYLDEYF